MDTQERQEPRNERQTLPLSLTELNDARLVASFRNVAVSVVLREESMRDIHAEAEQIRSLKFATAP